VRFDRRKTTEARHQELLGTSFKGGQREGGFPLQLCPIWLLWRKDVNAQQLRGGTRHPSLYPTTLVLLLNLSCGHQQGRTIRDVSLHKLQLHVRARLAEEDCKRFFLLAHHLWSSLGMCQASEELGAKDGHCLDMPWETPSPGRARTLPQESSCPGEDW